MDRRNPPSAAAEATPSTEQFAAAIREAEDWAAAAHEARRRLEALDAATVAISQELSLERVLQIIVDSVRPLVGARYAALGIPDDRGSMERFITSGISDGVAARSVPCRAGAASSASACARATPFASMTSPATRAASASRPGIRRCTRSSACPCGSRAVPSATST